MSAGVLVIGLGNVHGGDDAVGLHIARRVAATHPELRVLELDDPTAALDAWTGLDAVVVADAVRSGGEPGDLQIVDLVSRAVPAGSWAGAGTHALGLAQVVELARVLGSLPRSLVLVGVEAAQVSSGAPMTEAVAAAVPAAAARVVTLAADAG